MMPPLTLLIKPASGICNLDCTYCFYHDITQKRIQESYGFMSLDTMEQIIKRAFEFAENHCTFAFQGGEPTLSGLAFFEKTVELVATYNVKKIPVHFALQTNGYKLNEAWADFFVKHHFLIGISLDGTIHTHNAFRKNPSGNDSFEEVMDTINLFKRKNVDFNVLTVVNKRTTASIKKIYRFYSKQQFQFLQFIPCIEPFEELSGLKDYSLTPEAYGQFLCDLFDLWYEDIIHNKMVSIRLFDNYLSMLKGYPPESCDMRGLCSAQHVIEADGSVYPCDFFVFEKYKLGNVHNADFHTMHIKRNELKFIEESAITNNECKSCSYYFLCRGGCKRYRMMTEDSDYQKNYFCSSFKKFFDYSGERLAQLSKLLR